MTLFGGGSAYHGLDTTLDDVLLVLKPSLHGANLQLSFSGTTCSLVADSPRGRVVVELGDTSFERIWQAFKASIAQFVEQHKEVLHVYELPRDSVMIEATQQICGLLSLGDTEEVGVLPVFQTANTDEFVMLLRSCKPDGSGKVAKAFSNLFRRRIARLPVKARLMLCALKHVVKLVHRMEVPCRLFESVVLEVFEQQGWVGELDFIQQAVITFISVWRLCWSRILSWEPIVVPRDRLLFEREDVLATISETYGESLRHLGQELLVLDEHQLLTLLGERSEATSQVRCLCVGEPSTHESSSTSHPLWTWGKEFSLVDWLSALGLTQYLDLFLANGFEDNDAAMIKSLSEMDLREIGIAPLAHRKKLMRAMAALWRWPTCELPLYRLEYHEATMFVR